MLIQIYVLPSVCTLPLLCSQLRCIVSNSAVHLLLIFLQGCLWQCKSQQIHFKLTNSLVLEYYMAYNLDSLWHTLHETPEKEAQLPNFIAEQGHNITRKSEEGTWKTKSMIHRKDYVGNAIGFFCCEIYNCVTISMQF